MTHAFIITLTIPDSDSLPGVAEELHELVSDSFEVISVNPWGGEPPVGIASPADLPSPLDAATKLSDMEVSLDDLNELNHALDNCRYWLQHLSRNQKPDSDYFYNMGQKIF